MKPLKKVTMVNTGTWVCLYDEQDMRVCDGFRLEASARRYAKKNNLKIVGPSEIKEKPEEPEIVISIRSGIVQVEHLPANAVLIVKDYDIDGIPDTIRPRVTKYGGECVACQGNEFNKLGEDFVCVGCGEAVKE